MPLTFPLPCHSSNLRDERLRTLEALLGLFLRPKRERLQCWSYLSVSSKHVSTHILRTHHRKSTSKDVIKDFDLWDEILNEAREETRLAKLKVGLPVGKKLNRKKDWKSEFGYRDDETKYFWNDMSIWHYAWLVFHISRGHIRGSFELPPNPRTAISSVRHAVKFH